MDVVGVTGSVAVTVPVVVTVAPTLRPNPHTLQCAIPQV